MDRRVTIRGRGREEGGFLLLKVGVFVAFGASNFARDGDEDLRRAVRRKKSTDSEHISYEDNGTGRDPNYSALSPCLTARDSIPCRSLRLLFCRCGGEVPNRRQTFPAFAANVLSSPRRLSLYMRLSCYLLPSLSLSLSLSRHLFPPVSLSSCACLPLIYLSPCLTCHASLFVTVSICVSFPSLFRPTTTTTIAVTCCYCFWQRMGGVDDGARPFHTLVGPGQYARERSSDENQQAQPGGELHACEAREGKMSERRKFDGSYCTGRIGGVRAGADQVMEK